MSVVTLKNFKPEKYRPMTSLDYLKRASEKKTFVVKLPIEL